MFVHLHVHSNYSFLDSTLTVEGIVECAKAAGMPAVALTDANGLYAAVPFYKKARDAGVRPIIGLEVNSEQLTVNSDFQTPNPRPQTLSAVLLAMDRVGYAEISELATRRHLWGEPDAPPEGAVVKPRGVAMDDWRLGRCEAPPQSPIARPCFSLADELRALSPGHVVILTGDLGLLEALRGRENLYAELVLTRRSRSRCRRVYDFARRAGIPLVATGDVHFATPDDYELYRVLRAIGTLRTVETLDEEALVSPEHYFRDEAEMRRAFRGLGEAVDNAGRIAEQCRCELELGVWQFPEFELPEGETPFSHLWKAAFDGLRRRYRPLSPEAIDRLKYELEMIDRLGFSEYFLVVHAIVEEAHRRGYFLVGRGSAANSVVSYALGMTGVDPIRFDLYFERFLNPERQSPPDIDLDFSWKDRDDMVQWIFERFGRDRVALIATHICLRARQALREVAKAMGLAESEINPVTRHIEQWFEERRTIGEIAAAGGALGDLRFTIDDFGLKKSKLEALPALALDGEPWRTVVALAERITGFPRHLSIHCGGVVIAPRPISYFTPLQRAAKGHVITQMEMHAIEDLGLIKIDILSNRSLGVFKDCLKVLGVELVAADAAGAEEPATYGAAPPALDEGERAG